MTENQYKRFRSLKKKWLRFVQYEIDYVKDRAIREGLSLEGFDLDSDSLFSAASLAIDKLGVKFLHQGVRATFDVRLDKNILKLRKKYWSVR